MSQSNRMSHIPQIRRSSSSNGIDVQSQQFRAFNANNNTNRASSIDPSSRQSMVGRNSIASNRQSSIGTVGARPSSIGVCLKPTEMNDTAREIFRILMDLDYKLPISEKILLMPSASTFYSIFEFFMKYLGFGNDLWNPEILTKRNPNTEAANSKNKNAPASQQAAATSQAQIIAQNKAKVDLVVFYLTVLKFNNIPKLNVLQTMTTPKNWSHMLQILHFLANACWYLVIYDSRKILDSIVNNFENNHIVYDYLKEAYSTRVQDPSFLGSEKHQQMKNEFYKKYEDQLTKNSNLDELTRERDMYLKKFEHLQETKKSFDEALKEEQELIRMCNEEERLLALEKQQTEDLRKKVQTKKVNAVEQREKLKKMEEEIALKDKEYDKQLASGKKVDNLVNRHAQKVQQLESLQNTYVDFGNQKDDLQSKVIRRTVEVKEKINSINSIVNKIKLSSSIALNEFPQFDLVDFHKKTDFVKDYKDSLLEIRKNYSASICKLPEILSQSKEKKKLVESKLDAAKTKNKNLEKEIAKAEANLNQLKEEGEEALAITKKQLDIRRNEHAEFERLKLNALNEIEQEEAKLKETKKTALMINNDLQNEITKTKEDAKKVEEKSLEFVQANENDCVLFMREKMERMKEITEKYRQAIQSSKMI